MRGLRGAVDVGVRLRAVVEKLKVPRKDELDEMREALDRRPIGVLYERDRISFL